MEYYSKKDKIGKKIASDTHKSKHYVKVHDLPLKLLTTAGHGLELKHNPIPLMCWSRPVSCKH
jgi:hypothetical protein